jgi:hypothetical protein
MTTTEDLKDKAYSWFTTGNALEREVAVTYLALEKDYADILDTFMRGKFDEETQERLAQAVADTHSQLVVVRGIIRRTILREKE